MNNETPAINPDAIPEIRQRVLEWGIENYKEFPWRGTTNLWHGLVAELMLQRTRVASVEPVYRQFVELFPTPASLLQVSPETLSEVIYPLGLPERAERIRALAQAIVNNGNRIPDTYEELIQLPGVGNYVASAWLSFHSDKRAVLIDANVVRWLCRLILYPMDGETRRKPWLKQMAEEMTPQQGWKEYNYAVLDFTMEICARTPRCEVCPVGAEYCMTGCKILQLQSVSI